MATSNRPLSPHLDIYRWRITMMVSIIHRASGVVISFGMMMLILKLVLLATGGSEEFAPSGMLSMAFWFVWTIAVYLHLGNGVRHLVWDAGKGFDVPTAEKSAAMVLIGAVILTALTWLTVLV